MTIKDVASAFYNGREAESSTGSLRSTGYKLFSYSTVIAQRDPDIGIIKNITKYSTTTSKHQYLIDTYDVSVSDVPFGADNLTKYI